MVIIDRDAIERSGFNTVSGVLKFSTINSIGSEPGEISIRGLGATNTLILVNGNRLPKTGSTYNTTATNIDVIPISAVERIEALTDGASAIYGSEALSGVVNIITRKDFQGFYWNNKLIADSPKGGDGILSSLTYGKTLSKGNFSSSIQFSSNTKQYLGDLDYVDATGLNFSERSDNLETANGVFAFPNCPKENINEDGRCEQYYGDKSGSSSSYIISKFSELNYEVGDGLQFHADSLLRYGVGGTFGLSRFSNLTFQAGEASGAWVSEIPASQWSPGAAIRLNHQVHGGEQSDKNTTLSLGLNLGLSGEFFTNIDWTWELKNNFQIYQNKAFRNAMVLEEEAKKAIKNGVYNPF